MTRPKTDSEKAAWMRGYFLDTVVKGYMVGDLERMLEIEVCPNQYGNCNFPIALYTFGCMDYLGYLISKKPLRRTGEDTRARIRAYVDRAFTEQHKKPLDEFWNKGVNVFRYGLVHEFFPKKAGVSRANTQLMWWWEEHECWVLDADRLAEAFIESVQRLESLMEDKCACATMYDRYTDFLKSPQMTPPTPPYTPGDKTSATTLRPDQELAALVPQGATGPEMPE